ncbi:GroES-like protein [Epithele typhae]|uniref:GroES-like protein n=1 Tax=Epithele typhae TaxID=378194 RepID=UPI002007A83C|nr:GroES-like protein [Epithele typhae]KAH9921215.1 GroES-like protein [Epithele typhae]
MAPKTQKILLVPSERAPWELRTEFPVPTPEPGEVLIKVMAAGLNPADWILQSAGADFIESYPWTGGMDGAGVVEEVGENVTNVVKDDKVLFPGAVDPPRNSSFAEYSVAVAENVARVPENISLDQAATIPLCFATVVTGLWSRHPDAQSLDIPAPWEEGSTTKYAGQPALIFGASTTVGQFAVQVAHYHRFSPIIAFASPKHEPWLKSLGATHVVERALPPADVLALLPSLTGGKGVPFAFDARPTPESLPLAYDALARGGGLACVYPSAPWLDGRIKPEDEKKFVRQFGSFGVPVNKALGVEVYKRMTGWLEDGTIKPARVELVPGGLKGVEAGLEKLRKGR